MTFTMWSFGHLMFILSPVLLTVIFYYAFKNKSYEEKRKIGIKLSWIAIHILFLRNIEILISSGYKFDIELLPLQVCHFANFVLLYAFIKDSKPAFGLAFTINLAAAFVSILFADSLANYSNILLFRGQAYIWGHMLIVALSAWAFISNFVVMDKKTYIQTLKVSGILFGASLFINNAFGIFTDKYSNYFYTNHPEKGTPLEWFWDWGTELDIAGFKINIVYIIGTMILGFVVTLIMYGIAKAFKKDERLLKKTQ